MDTISFKRRSASLFLAVAVMLSMLGIELLSATPVHAASTPVNVKVRVNTENNTPAKSYDVTVDGTESDLIFFEDDANTVSAVDVLTAVHKKEFGASFNGNETDYVFVDSEFGAVNPFWGKANEEGLKTYKNNKEALLMDVTASESDEFAFANVFDADSYSDKYIYFDGDVTTETNGDISVKVKSYSTEYDEDFNPVEKDEVIEGAVVEFKSADETLEAKTDSNGVAKVTATKSGTFEVSVKSTPYEFAAFPAVETVVVEKEDATNRTVFVDSDYVASHKSDADTVVAEVSWGPDAPDQMIKGAIHVNTDDLESNGQDDGYELWDLRDSQNGYKKLMDTLATKYGITKDTNLICYGASGTDSAATRLAMAALMLGVKDVKVLNGGFEKWNGEKAAAAAPKTAAAFGLDAPAHPEYVISTDDMLKEVGKGGFKLVSIRSYDEFIGKNSGYAYIDKAGEPKGAIWGHDTDDGSYLKEDGTVVGYDKIVEYIRDYDASFDADKDETLAFYCGTGWRATIPFLIAYEAGKNNMKLWDDGWYVYCGAYADPWNWVKDDPAGKKPVKDYPVQLGDPKTGKVTETSTAKLETKYNPLRKLTAKSASVTLAPGTYDNNFEVMPPKNNITDSIIFTSSDEKVAKIDASGKVTVPEGAKIGAKATITATGNATFGSTRDKEGTHKTASYEVVVGKYLVNGQKAKVGGNTYKVLSAKSKTATLIKAKNKKSVTVPATIKINGQKLKVVQVNGKAFTGKKIKTVTIGKNVKKISKNAFKGSKVTKMIVKTKSLKKSKIKGSLKASKIKTIQVKVGNKKTNKSYVKKYKKIFTKKNAGKKVTVK